MTSIGEAQRHSRSASSAWRSWSWWRCQQLLGGGCVSRRSSVPEAHVRLEGVTKRFAGAGAAAVEDVSLRIPRGSFTTLLGPSGCGKTTTLRMIAGFYEPDTGDIFIAERRVNDVPVHRRKIAMVFQDYALFPHMSVEDNVSYGLRLAR